jgi:ribosomal peptide maturation radical SAM protein 1
MVTHVIDCLPEGDALIIVPPFAALDRAVLGPHLLQACAKRSGMRVGVFYANMAFAALIGEEVYTELCECSPSSALMGERIFCSAAYGMPPLGHEAATLLNNLEKFELKVRPEQLLDVERAAHRWAEDVARAVVHKGYSLVGCTSLFEQTSAAVAVLTRIKQFAPRVITVLGGGNCEGEMAEGVASLTPAIDYIFSGESEGSFVTFLRQALDDRPPSGRIVRGCRGELDTLPRPAYDEFFEQRAKFGLMHSESIWLPYESSRGCWWGEKHHCTFCGLNGLSMSFRQKEPDTVVGDLKEMGRVYPKHRVLMVDNIMPYDYFRTVIPRLPREVPGLSAFYEQKANLTFPQLVALKAAGVTTIQPGIEALSSSLLKRMNKGVSAVQNINLLRYARALDINVHWNLLYGFPGDTAEEYAQTLELIPYLTHTPPPSIGPLVIDRFSPYFDDPQRYGISNVAPRAVYRDVFPGTAAIEKLAYRFSGRYESAAHTRPELIKRIERAVKDWDGAWHPSRASPPVLRVQRLSAASYLLADTRGLEGTKTVQFLRYEEARAALVGGRLVTAEERAWGLRNKVAVSVEGQYVPLATADPALLAEFLDASRSPGPTDETRRPLALVSSRK